MTEKKEVVSASVSGSQRDLLEEVRRQCAEELLELHTETKNGATPVCSYDRRKWPCPHVALAGRWIALLRQEAG